MEPAASDVGRGSMQPEGVAVPSGNTPCDGGDEGQALMRGRTHPKESSRPGRNFSCAWAWRVHAHTDGEASSIDECSRACLSYDALCGDINATACSRIQLVTEST